MCTLSWRREPAGLEIWFNRDEQRSRPIALPPRLHEGPPSFLAPQDPQGGGTWMFVNEFGRAGSLLNFYEARATCPAQDSLRSRGALVRDLAQTPLEDDIGELLKDHVLRHVYAPFYFWSAGIRARASLWAWDGQRLEKRALPLPMHTTSSYRSEEVRNHRNDWYRDTVSDPLHPTSAELQSFHETGKTNGDFCSIHMSRTDARTVSTSHILLQEEMATYTYSTPDTPEVSVSQLHMHA